MSNFQALVLGMMLAWTPSLIALGYFLLRAPVECEGEWESTPGDEPDRTAAIDVAEVRRGRLA
jgi:hypothetical protein